MYARDHMGHESSGGFRTGFGRVSDGFRTLATVTASVTTSLAIQTLYTVYGAWAFNETGPVELLGLNA